MNIYEKLKLIKEGYVFNEINLNTINSSVLNFNEMTFADILMEDSKYLFDLTFSVLNESSDNGILSTIKRFFQWLKEKVTQFVTFVKNRFSTSKQTEDLEKKVKNIILNSRTYETYDLPVRSEIYKNDNDYLEIGAKKVYEVAKKYIENIIYGNGNSKVLSFEESIINDERKLTNFILNSALNVRDNNDEIADKIYGKFMVAKVKYIIDINKLIEKAKHMESEQRRIAEFISLNMYQMLEEYRMHIEQEIEMLLNEKDKLLRFKDYKPVMEINKKINHYKIKLNKFNNVYNCLIKITSKLIHIHKKATIEFIDNVNAFVDFVDVNEE